jgi:hypothetical protein
MTPMTRLMTQPMRVRHPGLRLGVCVACAAMLAAAVAPLAGAGRSDDKRTDRRNGSRTATARPVTGSSRAATAVNGTRTAIVGSAWDVDNSPIKFASLRLRDVVEGHIEALTKANEAGEFTFENVPPGSYAVELVNEAGKVETIGHVFTIAPGETVATFVRLNARVPWITAFFKNTAGAVAATAAATGVTALAPPRLCSSPPCND